MLYFFPDSCSSVSDKSKCAFSTHWPFHFESVTKIARSNVISFGRIVARGTFLMSVIFFLWWDCGSSLNVKWIPRSRLGNMLVFFFLCSMFASLLRVGLPVRRKISLKSQYEHLADAVEDILNRCFSIHLSYSNPVADPSQRPTCATQHWQRTIQPKATNTVAQCELAPGFHFDMYVWYLSICETDQDSLWLFLEIRVKQHLLSCCSHLTPTFVSGDG